MKKITFLIAALLITSLSSAQFTFNPISGPVNVAAGSPVTINLNNNSNSEGVTNSSTGSYDSFSVSVTWENGSGIPYSNEADLTFITAMGSTLIDPPTSGAAGSTATTTLTFEGNLSGLYDPNNNAYIDLVLNQSFPNSNANWSNISVTLFETPTCPSPVDLIAFNASESTIDLNWTEIGTATSWSIEYGPQGFTPGNGTIINNITSIPFTLTGLVAGVNYEFYVQSDCGNGDLSSFAGPFAFGAATLGSSCDFPIDIAVNSDCASAIPMILDFNVASDVGSFLCDGFVPNYGYYISFTAPSNGSIILKFSGNAQNIGYEVYDACGGNAVSNCNNNTLSAGDDSEIIGGLTPGATYYAALWRDQQSGTADLCIEEGASCPSPINLNATNINLNSATLIWTENGSATSWNIEWGSSGFSLGSGNTINNLTNTSYQLSNLNSSTSYTFYVQSNCTGETSTYAGPYTFTTQTPSRINFSQLPITLNTNSSFATAIVDMDGDFLDDIVGVQANNINIKQQNANGSFTDINVTTPNADYTPSWSIAAADYDANGKTDLLYGAGSGVTFMRASADGLSFTEQSTTEYVFSQRSNFIDINNDGNLDAFVCHDVEPNVYFINDGTGNFDYYQSDVTAGAPYSLGNFPSGGDYGSIWIDYNNDRNMDLFIAKCGGSTARRTNMMLTNNGDNTYTENAAAIGLADPMQTWSSAWGDFDNDGDMDVFVGASSGTHKLMENSGFSDDGNPNNDYIFTDVTANAGVSSAPTGWESSTFDIDNDGYLDIIANGTILYGKGDMTFEDADANQIDYKNGSFGDLNNDGFIDTYYSQTIYYNQGNTNNWVKINTIGMAHVTPYYSNRNGIGARIELVTSNSTQIRDVKSGEGFEFMSSLTSHFGIGSETTISEIRVYWPSGIVDVVTNPAINTTHNIVEGSFQLSLGDQSLTDFSIFPNPATEILTISTAADLNQRIATVFDITGKKVLNQKLMTNQVDISSLQSGVYFLRIENEGRSITRKFIKE